MQIDLDSAAAQLLLDHAPFGFVVIQQSKYSYANNAFADMVGVSLKNILSFTKKKAQALIHPEDLSLLFTGDSRRTKKLMSQMELRFIDNKSDFVWVTAFPTSLLYKQKSAIGYYIVNISKQKETVNQLMRTNDELSLRVAEKTVELHRKNIALSEVLKQLDVEKKNLEERINANIQQLLLPIVKKVRDKSSSIDSRYLNIIEQNLNDVTSRFGLNLSTTGLNLTTREIEVCNLIKSGFTAKEIATLLHLSSRTVETHCSHIRKKLGISSQKVNLSSYLLNM